RRYESGGRGKAPQLHRTRHSVVCPHHLVGILDSVHRLHSPLANSCPQGGYRQPAMSDACDYCGLPAPPPLWGTAEVVGPRYCCFGCRFAAAVTRARGEEGATTWTLARLGLAIFLTMNVMVFTMALWTQDFYDESTGGEAWIASLRDLFRYLSM